MGDPGGRLARVEFTDIDRDDMRNLLAEIGETHMPFGKFGPKDYPPAGVPIMDLPPEYLGWFKERGFPKGRLGELLEIVYEVKQSGADGVFAPLRAVRGGRTKLRKPRRRVIDFGED
ncbi:MAG: hypothetical protein HKN82_17895 [Akkermansiaceae bacterium]|nr:hypothetical protein [Akkermansiaceae bacterium]NNM30399.1 hypothetical protein [Akkermansiaceae bacterium]